MHPPDLACDRAYGAVSRLLERVFVLGGNGGYQGEIRQELRGRLPRLVAVHAGSRYEEDRPVTDSFELVRQPVRQGTLAAKFTVRQGYSRYGYGEDSELEWHSFEKPGDEYWYAWSTLFPTDWQPPLSWGIFAQWHARLGTSPIISFNARADTAVLDVRSGLTDERRNHVAGRAGR